MNAEQQIMRQKNAEFIFAYLCCIFKLKVHIFQVMRVDQNLLFHIYPIFDSLAVFNSPFFEMYNRFVFLTS